MRLASLVPLAALLLIGAAPAPVVSYEVSPVLQAGELEAIAVELTFKGDADGETVLRVPNEWGGNPDLWKHIEAITVDGGTAVEDGPARRIVTHRPGATLTVRYRVISGYSGDPTPRTGNPYRPVIRPTWFHLIGNAAFIEPDERSEMAARVRWTGWPEGWTLASDLDHGRMGRALVVGDLLESVSVGGTDLKVLSRPIDGGVLRLAVRGDWDFAADAFADQLATVISAQRRFWNDTREPYFVSLIPLAAEQGWRSTGGTGRDDGFALFATRNSSSGDLLSTLAHEHIHSWIPRRVGRMPQPGEQADYWFSEGFTDFYALRTLLRSGGWSLEDYLAALNEKLGEYDRSEGRAWPNSRILEGFWSNGTAKQLPYRRGLLLAYHWDAKVRQATGGAKDLDDVMLLMRDRFRARGEAPGLLVRDGFAEAFETVTGGATVRVDYENLVEKGVPFAFQTNTFGDCARPVETVRHRFVRGWDSNATAANDFVFTGVDPHSNAYAAGLRDGMKLIKREEGVPDDERVAYVLRVKDGETERLIRFLPAGAEPYFLRQIVLTPGLDAAGRERCRKVLSGDI